MHIILTLSLAIVFGYSQASQASYTAPSNPSVPGSQDQGSPTGAIVGGVVGGALGIAGIAGAVAGIHKLKKNHKSKGVEKVKPITARQPKTQLTPMSPPPLKPVEQVKPLSPSIPPVKAEPAPKPQPTPVKAKSVAAPKPTPAAIKPAAQATPQPVPKPTPVEKLTQSEISREDRDQKTLDREKNNTLLSNILGRLKKGEVVKLSEQDEELIKKFNPDNVDHINTLNEENKKKLTNDQQITKPEMQTAEQKLNPEQKKFFDDYIQKTFGPASPKEREIVAKLIPHMRALGITQPRNIDDLPLRWAIEEIKNINTKPHTEVISNINEHLQNFHTAIPKRKKTNPQERETAIQAIHTIIHDELANHAKAGKPLSINLQSNKAKLDAHYKLPIIHQENIDKILKEALPDKEKYSAFEEKFSRLNKELVNKQYKDHNLTQEMIDHLTTHNISTKQIQHYQESFKNLKEHQRILMEKL